MNQIPPHEALSVATSLFAGLFMLQLSLRKRAIRWKATTTRCLGCGRARRRNARCAHCS